LSVGVVYVELMERLFVRGVGVFGAMRTLMKVFLSPKEGMMGRIAILRGIGSLEAAYAS